MRIVNKKRVEYLKRRHLPESEIRLDQAKVLALLAELGVADVMIALQAEGVIQTRPTGGLLSRQ